MDRSGARLLQVFRLKLNVFRSSAAPKTLKFVMPSFLAKISRVPAGGSIGRHQGLNKTDVLSHLLEDIHNSLDLFRLMASSYSRA